MNKITTYFFDTIDRDFYGQCVLKAIDEHPEQYKILQKIKKRTYDITTDPKPLVKYFVRNIINSRREFGSSFNKSKSDNDLYAPVQYMKFANCFSYSASQGGFIPMYNNLTVSRWLKSYYEEKEQESIRKTWRKTREFLTSDNGGIPSLIYNSEDQHVYFMQRQDTNEIKIGLSYQPNIRKQQLKRECSTKIKLLFVLPSAGRSSEKQLHKIFREQRVHGEWFQPDSSLTKYIKKSQSTGHNLDTKEALDMAISELQLD